MTVAEDELVKILEGIESHAVSQECYTDICDGHLYKELASSGILGDLSRRYVSLTFNTDGIPVFRSSGYQFGHCT